MFFWILRVIWLATTPSCCRNSMPFVASLSESYEYSSIVDYVSSLIPFHQLNDLDPPDTRHCFIRQALAGVKRQRFDFSERKRALLPLDLKAIFDHLYVRPEECRTVFWSACLVPFFSLLRRSDLFYDKASPNADLRVEDVTISTDKILPRERMTKTSRFLGSEIGLPLKKHQTVSCALLKL